MGLPLLSVQGAMLRYCVQLFKFEKCYEKNTHYNLKVLQQSENIITPVIINR